MGIFGASSPFDQAVEKATSELNTEESWTSIIEICDKVGSSPTGPKDCLRAIVRRLTYKIPIVQLQALTLLDACVKNCGKAFHREVASRDFTNEAKSIIKQANPKVADKFKEILKRWSDNEFKLDSALSIIPSFYNNLKSELASFNGDSDERVSGSMSSSAKGLTAPSKEDDDLQKAIALSLKEAEKQTSTKSASLYPMMPSVQPVYQQKKDAKEARKVTALYDFEAAEDNELTFKAGEVVTVTDDSDANWWKGNTWRGEGLFPASFVTSDLTAETEEGQREKKAVQFSDSVLVKHFDPEMVHIDEAKIDQALSMIQNADPTGEYEDSPEMLDLEAECKAMVPLIDQELQRTDRTYNELAELNRRLGESFQMYTDLMQETQSVPSYGGGSGYVTSSQQSFGTGIMAAKGYGPIGVPGFASQQQQQQSRSMSYNMHGQPVMTTGQPVVYSSAMSSQQQLPAQSGTSTAMQANSSVPHTQQYQLAMSTSGASTPYAPGSMAPPQQQQYGMPQSYGPVPPQQQQSFHPPGMTYSVAAAMPSLSSGGQPPYATTSMLYPPAMNQPLLAQPQQQQLF